MTTPRHYPRLDTTVCPDQQDCRRRYHGRMEVGDVCECCGAEIKVPCCPAMDDYLAGRQRLPGHSPSSPGYSGCLTIYAR
jgi:hypothetical protein